MADDNVAEGAAARTVAATVASAAPPPAPVPGPAMPVDMPAAASTPKDVDPFSVAASAVAHLLIGLLVFGSLASVQKPPEIIPVKLIPADQAPPEAQKAAEPQPAQKPKQAAPPEKTAPSPPPPKDTAEPDKAASDNAKEPGKAETAKPEATRPWKDIAESLGMAEYGRKTTLPDALLAELDAQVKRCWTAPSGWNDPREVAVTLRFLLRRDGTLDGEPSVVEFPATPAGAASAQAAIAAVTRCGPFHLPADRYEQWKDIQLKLAP